MGVDKDYRLKVIYSSLKTFGLQDQLRNESRVVRKEYTTEPENYMK